MIYVEIRKEHPLMYDKLKDIFLNVNEWLKFAEAKHAALIAFNVATLFGLISTYSSLKALKEIKFKYIEIAISISLFFVVGSIIYSLWNSFFPKTKPSVKEETPVRVSNLFFWGDTRLLTRQTFLQELNILEENCPKLELNLIDQIIQNSKIASNKYETFEFSVILTGLSYIILSLYLIYHVFN